MDDLKNKLHLTDTRMVVQLSVEELRAIVADAVEQKLKQHSATRPGGMLNAEQAAEYLGYSRDWVFKNWKKIGGQKIGGRGIRFEPLELQRWIDSRKTV